MTLVRLPNMELVNVANAREHHMQRSQRSKSHRRRVCAEVKKALGLARLAIDTKRETFLPAIVTITRIAPRKLDAADGLRIACKNVIDGVADALVGKLDARLRLVSDDSDPRLTFRCNQVYGGVKTYGCLVRIEPRVEGPIRCWNDTASVQVEQSDAVLGPHAYIVLHDESEDNAAGVPFPAPQLRAFVTQCETALAELEQAELKAEVTRVSR